MSLVARSRDVVSRTGGAALQAAARGLAAVRPSAKPLHPRGQVVLGTLRRRGLEHRTGVAWLDEAGQDDVVVRRSRAVGLPDWLPDIHGIALRVPVGEDAYGDLLLASTGWGAVTRFVLTASREPAVRPLTTLLPYRTARGPLLLGARALGPDDLELSCAHSVGAWQPFADLHLTATGTDPTISFDPVRNRIPGLEQYRWVTLLREPSYRTARDSRR